MKFIRATLVFLFIVTLFTACKKEGPQGPAGHTGPTGISTTPNPDIYDKWEVIAGLPSTRYIIIKKMIIPFINLIRHNMASGLCQWTLHL